MRHGGGDRPKRAPEPAPRTVPLGACPAAPRSSPPSGRPPTDEATLKELISAGHGRGPHRPGPRRPRRGPRALPPGPRRWPPTSTARSASWPTCPAPRCGPATSPSTGVMLDRGRHPAPGAGSRAEHGTRWCRSTTTHLLHDVRHGDQLGFGDGAVVVEAIGDDGDSFEVRVIHGGPLDRPPRGAHPVGPPALSTPPTAEDLVMLDAFVEAGVDMVAISFVRSAHDVRRVGVEPHPRGPLVVAKIETRAAVENLDGIIEASGRHHGGPRRPRGRDAHRGAAPPPEADPAQVHRPGSAGHHRHPDARVHGPRARPRPGPRPPTSPTPCSTAPRRSCSRARRPSATTRSTRWAPWPASPAGPTPCSTTRAGRAALADLRLTSSDDVDLAVTDAMTMAVVARRPRDPGGRHPLHHHHRLHRPLHRPAATRGPHPGLQPRRAHRAPARHELGRPGLPARAGCPSTRW